MYFTLRTQNPALVYFIGIDEALPKKCMTFVSQGTVQDWRDMEVNCTNLEMHTSFGTAREIVGSDTQLPRLPSVPLKVTAVTVSDGIAYFPTWKLN